MSLHKNCCNEYNTIQKDSSKSCDCNKTTQKSQSCFNIKKLPDIENIEQLAYELCKVQQGFDKCPQYYTKQNYDVLLKVLNGAFFHLYNKEAKNVKLQEDIEYLSLLNLVNSKQLKKGQEYKIIDYTFTTTQENTESAHNDFDIIVTADTEDTLSEDARACKKEGDEYFANSNLSSWELKYNIFNDVEKYAWADTENGKGVIYWMKDEFGNEAGYDFKSALFGKEVKRDQQYYINKPYIEECSLYITFNKEDEGEVDLSLIGNFSNCKIEFQKSLPFIKLTYKGSNININGNSAYIYDGNNINVIGSLNYIVQSNDLYIESNKSTVINSQDIVTKEDNVGHYIKNCRYIQLGFENSSNYLENCYYVITDSRVSLLDINNWEYCKINSDVTNLIAKTINLKYSTIGYNNKNVIFKGTDTFSNKTIDPSTFTNSWQEPSYEFEFNSNIQNEYETISKKQFVTYID